VIRLGTRQFRAQGLVAVAALTVAAIVLTITGAQLAHLYDTTVAGCQANGNCSSVMATLVNTDRVVQLIGVALILIPAAIGIFWGAPLVARELENGTHRMVWTQSVTRTRWIIAKLGIVGGASMLVTGLFSLMVTWWFSPIDRVNMNQFSVFDQRDIAPIGYAAFAFVLGVTAGVLVRRTLPAMATTVVAFVGVRMAMIYWIRPNLFAPAHTGLALSSTSDLSFGLGASGTTTFMAGTPTIPNAWVLSSQVVDTGGQAATDQSLHQFLVGACPTIASPQTPDVRRGPANPTIFHDCITQLSAKFHLAVTYQPADRYWTFQWYETAIFVGLAVLLAGFCFWWVRRRLS
jgi:hypothetical protein